MKSTDPQFGDENIFSFIPNTDGFLKEYHLTNGASFTLTLAYDERKSTYSIEVTDVKGSIKDFRFLNAPKSVIICKESMYKYECIILSNFGISNSSLISLNFAAFFNLKPKHLHSAHNQVFKHGLFRSLSVDEYIEFIIRHTGTQKIYCIIRKVFIVNDSAKTSYFIYFNWNNREGDERDDQSTIFEMNTETFMIITKTPMNDMESIYFKMLNDAINDRRSYRKCSAS